MKKRWIAWIVLCQWLVCANMGLAASAAWYGTAVVDGRNADRVHLRERSSARSDSLGLYFTGTEVLCESDPTKEWVRVRIGSESGYMRSEFLRLETHPNSVQPKQPTGVVLGKSAGSWVNLRAEPSLRGEALEKCSPGDVVTVLGESVGRWYYVRAAGQYGYILSDYLAVSPAQDASRAYEMLLYTQAPNAKSSIQIQYPRFYGKALEALNALVYEKMRSLAQIDLDIYSRETGLTMDYRCAVTLQNSKIVSMIFWGSSYVEGGVYPYGDLIALNVDLASLREVRLTDLYAIDAEFEKVFFKKAFFPTNPVTSYDAASFSEMLKQQTQEWKTVSAFEYPESISYFLKPDGIVLSMYAVHATGSDHFEGQLRYRDIQRFYRLSQRYWED